MPGKPNILLVIADDMGVHQLGCYGSGFYETPNLDALAASGARFGCAYSASPVCSPARAALYTGLHPARLHLTNFIPGTEPSNPRLLTPPWRRHLPVEVDTLGDIFKALGYATGHFGKWHFAPDYHYSPGRPMDPESQGFDSVHVTRKPANDADPESDAHHIDALAADAIAFMEANRVGPFLCVVAHNALHRPEIAPAALVEKYRRKHGSEHGYNRPAVAAMVELLDRSVGTLMEHLRAAGLARETIVVFTSDHGAFGRSAERKPLRGAKADLYEAGIRVPLMIRFAGRAAPGSVVGAPVFGTDLLPTLLELAGHEPQSGIDGRSLAPLLGDPSGPAPHAALFWHFPHYHHLGYAPSGSMRSGRWKLIEWFEQTVAGAGSGAPVELYDLDEDPGETADLASREPARCDEMLAKLRAWRREVGAQEMEPNPRFDPALGAGRAAPPPGDPVNPFGE